MKKGQLYIGVVIIIAAALVGVYSSSFALRYDTRQIALDELCTQFKSESYLVINTAIEQKEELTGAYYTFTRDYVQYARSLASTFGVTAVFYYHNTTELINMLDTSVTYALDGVNMSVPFYPTSGHVQYLPRAYDVHFTYDERSYNVSSTDAVAIKMLCVYRAGNKDKTVII